MPLFNLPICKRQALILILLILTCAVQHPLYSQKGTKPPRQEREQSWYDEKNVDYTTRIYDSSIHTLLVHNSLSELEWPIIPFNGSEKVVLRFDDLGPDLREMHYTFVHCTHNWQPSDLLPMDYLTGFNSDIIQEFDYSFNTTRSYTHYRLEFPNDRIGITRSGNYIIKVYADGDQRNLILTARFMVFEPRSTIAPVVRPSSVVAERDYRQEVDLDITLQAGLQIMNPYTDVELVLLQNFRWDNAKTGVKPSFIKDNKLTYDYQRELTFDGGNEFRFFDAKSLRYRSERVQEVKLEPDGYHIVLAPDPRRGHLQYIFQNDINGRLLVKNDDMQNAHLESDYVTVHFTVPSDAMLGPGNMYLYGQLSNWKIDKDFRLAYNEEHARFEKTLLLKQGYYNYKYLWQYARAEASEDLTEGNHSQTENEFVALVYFKDRSSFADRLIGFKKFSNFNR
jgi:hypothetical protein